MTLGLANRAKADLESVRCSNEPGTPVQMACETAWGLISRVSDKLEMAEYEFRIFELAPDCPEVLVSVHTQRAMAAMRGIRGLVQEASSVVREHALMARPTPVTWLSETDGALSQGLVDAVDAAKMFADRLADVAGIDKNDQGECT